MSQQSKQQVFPYSMRTIAAINQTMCSYRAFMYIVPPKSALTIENLYTHFVMLFDAAVAAADRKILSIGISDQVPFITDNANFQRQIDINQSADANRRVDLAIDLSALLKRTNAGYKETTDSSLGTGYTYVEILLPLNIGTNANTGTIELWKIDALYTTTGIR